MRDERSDVQLRRGVPVRPPSARAPTPCPCRSSSLGDPEEGEQQREVHQRGEPGLRTCEHVSEPDHQADGAPARNSARPSAREAGGWDRQQRADQEHEKRDGQQHVVAIRRGRVRWVLAALTVVAAPRLAPRGDIIGR